MALDGHSAKAVIAQSISSPKLSSRAEISAVASLVRCTRFAKRPCRSSMNSNAKSTERSATSHDGISLVSALIEVQVHASPASPDAFQSVDVLALSIRRTTRFHQPESACRSGCGTLGAVARCRRGLLWSAGLKPVNLCSALTATRRRLSAIRAEWQPEARGAHF